jgi:hypothetical protein
VFVVCFQTAEVVAHEAIDESSRFLNGVMRVHHDMNQLTVLEQQV